MGAHAGCLHPRRGGGKGEQPFTATALLGSADRHLLLQRVCRCEARGDACGCS